MKKFFPIMLLFVITMLCASNTHGQSDKRYALVMNIQYKGKPVKVDLQTFSYSFNREVYEGDSSAIKKNYVYINLAPINATKDLLLLLKDKTARFNIELVVTDTYGKHQPTTTLFKNASFTNFSSTSTTYGYDAEGSVNISANAESVSTDGVEIEP